MNKDDVTRSPTPAIGNPPASCQPFARLFADRVLVTRTDGLSQIVEERVVPLIELRFDYGGTLLAANDTRSRVFHSTADGLVSLARDTDAETRARCALERLGALDLECIEAIAAPDGCEATYVVDG